MKKIFLLVLLLLSLVSSKAQFAEEDKQAHFAFGSFIGSGSNAVTYVALSQHTKIKPIYCSIISFVVGSSIGTAVGHLKESYDSRNGGFYSRPDFNYTLRGAVCGSLTITLFTNWSIPECRINKEELLNFEEFPLTKK